MSTTDKRVVFCTCPSDEVATTLARSLVEADLAACVNIVDGVRSIYRWDGAVCDDDEILLVIKTTADRFEALRQQLVAEHPYDCPEVIALPITAGHPAYLDWISAQVSSPKA